MCCFSDGIDRRCVAYAAQSHETWHCPEWESHGIEGLSFTPVTQTPMYVLPWEFMALSTDRSHLLVCCNDQWTISKAHDISPLGDAASLRLVPFRIVSVHSNPNSYDGTSSKTGGIMPL